MRYFSKLNRLKAVLLLTLSCLALAPQVSQAEKHKTTVQKTKGSSQGDVHKKSFKTEKRDKAAKNIKNTKSSKLSKQVNRDKSKHSQKRAKTAQSLAENSLRTPAIPQGKELSPKLPPLAAGSQRILGQGIGSELPKSTTDVNPIKANGIWVGSIDGKQAYRLGDALYMDSVPSNIYTKPVRLGNYPQLPPMPVIEGGNP